MSDLTVKELLEGIRDRTKYLPKSLNDAQLSVIMVQRYAIEALSLIPEPVGVAGRDEPESKP